MMEEKDPETTNSQVFQCCKEKVMEAGKLILPPGMQDDTWRAYIRIGYSPFMAADEWKNAL